MPTGPSGDPAASPPEETGQTAETGPSDGAESLDGTKPPPSGAQRHSWLTRPGRTPVVWAAAGLVVIGGAGAILATHESGGEGQPRTEAAQCGLLSCADVPSAAASTPSGPAPVTPSPPPPATPAPAPTPKAAPVPASARPPGPATAPAPAGAPAPGAAPAPASNPAPTTTQPSPGQTRPAPHAHGARPPHWPAPHWGFHSHGRHARHSRWWR
jgi:hypothetical protein